MNYRLSITGGFLKGRVLKTPRRGVRPAMSRMRESLFSILWNIEGLSFLDLFSGSGLMAIEAFSRGATPVHLVEKDKKKIPFLKKNIALTDDKIVIHCQNVETFIKNANEPFDLIYIDPPFDYPSKRAILASLSTSPIVSPSTKILLHHPTYETIPDRVGDLATYDKRFYGQSELIFMSYMEQNSFLL